MVAFDDEKGELEQINVLYSFLENRYMKQVRTTVPRIPPFEERERQREKDLFRVGKVVNKAR